ncbi:TonB-dependent receptor [Cellvibrio mixtus]|uniref:TonB-dependent receptor n=1 Tax=Cellvibrio mixtus TaxID=39650 RepID=UPI000587D265|nr:TonB-dependent receptor [Cellvibrio mixtus]
MYKKTALATAMLAAMLAQLSSAQEQEQVEEVIVQGIRGSLSKALDIKRENTQIVDAIVAEDIGKFPDNNVVEALQRVTGVQTTGRGGGEVDGISIRGLTDVHTSVNGRDVFTGAGRDVAIWDIPASLLSSVDVYKTRSADRTERGIAGSIDVKTNRPFMFDGEKVVLAARGIYTDQPDKIDPNISALYSNRWELESGGEFGALINVGYAETHYRDDTMTAGAVYPFFSASPASAYSPYQMIPNKSSGSDVWQAGLETGIPYTAGSTLNVDGQTVDYLMMRDAVFGTSFSGFRKRPAASFSLQWAPNDDWEFLAEGFYTGYRNTQQNAMWFTNVLEHQNGNIDIPIVYEGTNVVKEHQGRDNGGFQSGDYSDGKTDSYLYALGAKWAPSDKLTVNSELVLQESKYTTNFFAMRFDRTAYGLDVDYNDRDGIPSVVFRDNPATALDESDMAAVANWRAGTVYDNGSSNEGDSVAYTLDADWQLDGNFIDSIKVGGRYQVRSAEVLTRDDNAGIANTSVSQLMQLLTAAGASGDGSGLIFTVDNYFDGRATIFDSFITADGSYLLRNQDAVRAVYSDLDAPILTKSFNVDEDAAALYVTSKFHLSDSLNGELGLRAVDYQQDLEFWKDGVMTLGDSSATEVLPSLVLNWNITDEIVGRAAYTETLRMPEYNALNPNQDFQDPLTSTPYGTGTGGNPGLKPTYSKNYDLSLEWYFAEGSSLYGAVFKREIDGLVINGKKTIVREGDDGKTRPYVLNAPVNAADGELSGLEIGLVYFPDNLPAALDGLGVQASYTMLDSEQLNPEFAEDGSVSGYNKSKMSGVSDSSYSVVLAYEKESFGARLSYVWREKFFQGNEASIFANPIQFWSRPEQDLSFQLNYDVTDELAITFDGTNLLDDVYQNYYGEGNQNLFNFGNAIYSKTYAIGVRYAF